MLSYALQTWTPTKRDSKQFNTFERKVCKRILSPGYNCNNNNNNNKNILHTYFRKY